MIKIKILGHNKQGSYNKLSVFDFDGTLFKSPEKPDGYKGNWWIKKDSLGEPSVPEKPDDSFWNLDVVRSAKKELAQPKTLCIFLTGRIGQFFQDRITHLLRQKGLQFAQEGFNEFGRDAGEFKIEQINNILNKYPSIKQIEMWEDEPEKAELYNNVFGKKLKIKINKINVGRLNEMPYADIDSLPKEFKDSLPKEVLELLKQDGVLDFVREKFPTITGDKFYVDLGGFTYLVNSFGDVEKIDSEKHTNIKTLPKEWLLKYVERMKL